MATKSAPEAITEFTPPQPGEVCQCCGRKVPANAKLAMTPEEKRERQREYNSRPEVIERRKAYQARRREELKELRNLQQRLEAEANAETQDVTPDE